MEKELINNLLRLYSEAWIKRDPEKILTIFHPDATYHEKLFEKPYRGHKEIKEYWRSKVVGEQEDIHFKLEHIFIDGDTVIAEWTADFYNRIKKTRVWLKEIAVFTVAQGKIKEFREYWHSKEEKS